MNKIFIPRNISGGWLSMGVPFGPFTITIFQLITLAVGLGISLGVRNVLFKNGVAKYAAFLIVLPILLIFVFIAFFKYSELTLFPFIAKMIRTYFLDTTQKFQINRLRPDVHAINLARFRRTDHDVIIEKKMLKLEKEKLKKMQRLVGNKNV